MPLDWRALLHAVVAVGRKLYVLTRSRSARMDDMSPELAQATEELAFWQDFATWSSTVHNNTLQPRIANALALAQKRYANALQKQRILRLLKL